MVRELKILMRSGFMLFKIFFCYFTTSPIFAYFFIKKDEFNSIV